MKGNNTLELNEATIVEALQGGQAMSDTDWEQEKRLRLAPLRQAIAWERIASALERMAPEAKPLDSGFGILRSFGRTQAPKRVRKAKRNKRTKAKR